MSFRRKRRRPGGDLGRAIRAIRRRLDLDQGEFAGHLKWHRTMINQCELGTTKLSAGRLIQLLHLHLTEEERKVVLAALEAKGISASDLSITPSDAFATATVSDGAVAEARVESMIDPEAGEGATS